jgi:hypothetical protein
MITRKIANGADEFRISLHLTEDASQRAGQLFRVRKVSIMSSGRAGVSPQSLGRIQVR